MQLRVILYADRLFISPYVLSSFVALKEKSIDFEVKPVDLGAAEQHAPGYVQRSLTSRVPTIADGDFSLSESSAIAEYLDEAYPSGARLFPADRRARARARQVMAFLRSDLAPLREERSSESVFYPRPALPPLSPAGRKAAAKLIHVTNQLLGSSTETAFGTWCLADVDLAMMIQRLIKTGEPVPAPIVRYVEAQWSRPSVKAFLDLPRAPYQPYNY